MLLQDVHTKKEHLQTSSLYCIWVQRNPGSPLQAVWIDSEMRSFETQCKAGRREMAAESIADDPSPALVGVIVRFQIDRTSK